MTDTTPDAARADARALLEELLNVPAAPSRWVRGIVRRRAKRAVRHLVRDALLAPSPPVWLGRAIVLLDEIDGGGPANRLDTLAEAFACATDTANGEPAYPIPAIDFSGEVPSWEAAWVPPADFREPPPFRIDPTALGEFCAKRKIGRPEDRNGELEAAAKHISGAAAAERFRRLHLALAAFRVRFRHRCHTSIDAAALCRLSVRTRRLVTTATNVWLCKGRFAWGRLLWFIQWRMADDVPEANRWAVEGGLGAVARPLTDAEYAEFATLPPPVHEQPDKAPGGVFDVAKGRGPTETEREVANTASKSPAHSNGKERSMSQFESRRTGLAAAGERSKTQEGEYFREWQEAYSEFTGQPLGGITEFVRAASAESESSDNLEASIARALQKVSGSQFVPSPEVARGTETTRLLKKLLPSLNGEGNELKKLLVEVALTAKVKDERELAAFPIPNDGENRLLPPARTLTERLFRQKMEAADPKTRLQVVEYRDQLVKKLHSRLSNLTAV